MTQKARAGARVILVLVGCLAALLSSQLVVRAVLGALLGRPWAADLTVDTLRGEGVYVAAAKLAGLAYSLAAVALVLALVYRGRPLDRALVVLGSYLGASAAAGFSIALAFTLAGFVPGHSQPPSLAGRMVQGAGQLYGLSLLATTVVAVLALLPAAAVIAYAERKGVRSAAFYGGMGAAIGLVFLGVFAPAGLIAGLVYWALAGRSAGAARERAPAPLVG